MNNESTSKTAIVFGITRELAPAVGSVLLDLIRAKQNKNFDVHIYHDGISKRNKKALQKIMSVNFKRFTPSISHSTRIVPSVRQFTPMVFSKYECIKLLSDYESVLWLDCDIIIQSNIDEIFEFQNTDMVFVSGTAPVRSQFVEKVDHYDMDSASMSAGIIVFNRNQLSDHHYSYCLEQTEKFSSNLVMPEQAIFELLIQDFELNCVRLDSDIYACHPSNPNRNLAKIVHAYGQPKFWNGRFDTHWQNNHEVWLGLGGAPYRNWVWIRRIRRKAKFIGNLVLSKTETESS